MRGVSQSTPIILGNRSRRCPTSSIPGVVHPCSRVLLPEGEGTQRYVPQCTIYWPAQYVNASPSLSATVTRNDNTHNPNETVADKLVRLLADTYTLYLRTRNFHWNVKGPLFQQLHTLFQEQYTELAQAVDQIAERIRALDTRAPGTYAEYSMLTSIQETLGAMSAEDMLRALLVSHQVVVQTARKVIPAAMEVEDDASVDVAIQRIQSHEKASWMLRSILEV